MGLVFDAHCMVVQIFYTVEHILLQYHRADICVYIFLLLYSISYIVDLARVFVSVIYICTL